MKKYALNIALALVISAFATMPVRAETVRTCTSMYGGGEVCGESTTSVTTTVEHKTVDAGLDEMELWQVLAGVVSAAVVTSLLYKATYRWYILG